MRRLSASERRFIKIYGMKKYRKLMLPSIRKWFRAIKNYSAVREV